MLTQSQKEILGLEFYVNVSYMKGFRSDIT